MIGASDGAAFDNDELGLLDELAQTLAFGVESVRIRAQRKEAEARVAHLAYYDQLTGLPNRTLLLTTLQTSISDAATRSVPLALLHIEVGRFRNFSQIMGYQAADELIVAVCSRLSAQLEGGRLLTRVGEAEFALLLADTDACSAAQVAKRLVESMKLPFGVRGMLLGAKGCVGIAVFPDHGRRPSALMSRSKAAIQHVAPLIVSSGCKLIQAAIEN